MTQENETVGDLDPRWAGVAIPKSEWHFCRQLFTRYGVVLAPGDYSALKAAVRDGDVKFMHRRGEATVYQAQIKSTGRKVYVLADPSRLITAWPRERVKR